MIVVRGSRVCNVQNYKHYYYIALNSKVKFRRVSPWK